ncbi:ribonuclease H-like domain-containing protein [Tanacetum coccineum]
MHDHREPHLAALKRILCYVCGTSDYGIQLYYSSTSSLVTYSDVDWAGCPTARRSTSVAETSWLHKLLRELHSPLHSATIVYCDNVYTIGQVRVLHVSSRYQYADIFTNGFPTALFDELRTSLSIFVLPLQLREAISGLVLHVYHSLY